MYRLIRVISYSLFIVVIGASPLMAVVAPSVPEIDPSMAPIAIALISGGVAILKSKIHRK